MNTRATLPPAADGGGPVARGQPGDIPRHDAGDLDIAVVTTAGPTQSKEPANAWWTTGTTVAAIGVAVVFAVFVVWSVVSGAIRRAYSDDWGYLRIAQNFLDHGRLDGVGWNDTNLVGQIIVSKLISPITGSSVAGLRTLSILCAAGSLVLTAYLGRRTRASMLWALAPLTLVVMIGFGSTIATYMTEQPALLAQLGALSAGIATWNRWSRSGRLPLAGVIAIGVVGAWGGSIRQAAIAAPLAALAVLLAHPRARPFHRRLIVGVAVAVIASVVLLMAFTPLSGPTMAIVRGSVAGQVARIYQAAATLAVFLTPVAIVTGWFRRTCRTIAHWWGRTSGRIALVAVGLLVALGGALLGHANGSLLVGNSLQQAGGYQGTDTTFPRLFDPLTWTLVTVLSAATLFLLVVLAADGLRRLVRVIRRDGRRGVVALAADTTPLTRMIGIWTTLAILGALAVNIFYRAIYDRYLVPVVIGMALLAIDNRADAGVSRPRVGWAAVAFVPLLVLAVASAVDSQDLVDLRWAGAERLVELGYRPDTIDAGFDWVGFHYRGLAQPDQVVEQPPEYPPASYDVYFPEFTRCAFVSAQRTAPSGYVRVDHVTHHRLFGLRSVTAYLYGSTRNGSATCPAIAGG